LAVSPHRNKGIRINPDNNDIKEIIYYYPAYDKEYLTKLRQKAKKSWQGITDPDIWLREMRGGYNA